jgi:hypothetical protein
VKDFGEGLLELSEFIGHGDLVGSVIVDQIYAHYQHERLDLHHPRGGGPKYLERPLYEDASLFMEIIAENLLKDGPVRGMAQCMEHLSARIEITAPVLFWNLRRSGHPMVTSDGEIVYDREPYQHRLTEEELKAEGRLIPMPPALIGWIWWHVMHMHHPPPHSRYGTDTLKAERAEEAGEHK